LFVYKKINKYFFNLSCISQTCSNLSLHFGNSLVLLSYFWFYCSTGLIIYWLIIKLNEANILNLIVACAVYLLIGCASTYVTHPYLGILHITALVRPTHTTCDQCTGIRMASNTYLLAATFIGSRKLEIS
jgi:hypothetical protein